MSEAQLSTDRSNPALIPKIASQPFELVQRPEAMLIAYEPIRATDSTSSSGRSADGALPCDAVAEAEVARNALRLRWLLLAGLVLTCAIGVLGSARQRHGDHALGRRCIRTPGRAWPLPPPTQRIESPS